mmetsp:Transcript_86260/g.243040  ORF Transcript_86260/g.243040 Transcript_86260/m.243040 type:complete len:479 (-) Transcript_86260:224-1660(-)
MADLLLIDLPAAARLGDLVDDLLLAVLALLVVRIDCEALIVGLHGLVVLLHEEVDNTLPGVGLHELGVQPQALLQVLERIGIRHQLREGGRAVGVHLGVDRVPLDALIVLSLGLNVLLLLEELVALLAVLLGLCGIDVRILVVLLLGPLELAQSIPGDPVVVLHQCPVVIIDGGIEVHLLLVDGGQTIQDLGHFFEGCAARVGAVDFVPPGDDIFQGLDRLVPILCSHLDPDSALVVHVEKLVGLLLDGLVVHLECLLELFLLVQVVALRLELVGLLLFGSALVRRLLLFGFLLLRRRARGRGCRAAGRAAHLVCAGHRADVHALHRHDNLQDPGVRLHDLHQHLLLHARGRLTQLHDHLDLLHQLFVLHVSCNFRVLHCNCSEGGRVEGETTKATTTTTSTDAGTKHIVLGIAGLFQALLQRRILRCQLEAGLVGVDRVVIFLQEVLCKALASVALGPIRLQFHTLCAILQCLLVLL